MSNLKVTYLTKFYAQDCIQVIGAVFLKLCGEVFLIVGKSADFTPKMVSKYQLDFVPKVVQRDPKGVNHVSK